MERTARALSIAAVCLLPIAGLAAESLALRMAPDGDSRLELQVAKTGLMSGKSHVFVFKRWAGELEYDSDEPGQSQALFEIEAASIVCEDDWLSTKNRAKVDQEARGPMLGVDEHPTIRFRSTAFQAHEQDDRFNVEGELEIRGLSRPVHLEVFLSPAPGGVEVVGTAVVRLKDYNLKPPSAGFGTIGTRNEMGFSFQMTARPQ